MVFYFAEYFILQYSMHYIRENSNSVIRLGAQNLDDSMKYHDLLVRLDDLTPLLDLRP